VGRCKIFHRSVIRSACGVEEEVASWECKGRRFPSFMRADCGGGAFFSGNCVHKLAVHKGRATSCQSPPFQVGKEAFVRECLHGIGSLGLTFLTGAL